MQNMSEEELMALYSQYDPSTMQQEEQGGGDFFSYLADIATNPVVQLALMFTPVGGAVGKGLGAGANLLAKTSGMGARAMGPAGRMMGSRMAGSRAVSPMARRMSGFNQGMGNKFSDFVGRQTPGGPMQGPMLPPMGPMR